MGRTACELCFQPSLRERTNCSFEKMDTVSLVNCKIHAGDADGCNRVVLWEGDVGKMKVDVIS